MRTRSNEDLRTESLQAKTTKEVKEKVVKAADEAGMSESTWLHNFFKKFFGVK